MNWRDPIESNGIVRTGTQLISKFPSYSRSYEAETAHIMALDMCLANDIGLKKIKNMRNARVFVSTKFHFDETISLGGLMSFVRSFVVVVRSSVMRFLKTADLSKFK